LKYLFENHRGSGAVAFFSNVTVRQRQLFSRDGYLEGGTSHFRGKKSTKTLFYIFFSLFNLINH
jgi:hypothetical protein